MDKDIVIGTLVMIIVILFVIVGVVLMGLDTEYERKALNKSCEVLDMENLSHGGE